MNEQWSHSISQMIRLSNTEEVCGYAYLWAVKYKQKMYSCCILHVHLLLHIFKCEEGKIITSVYKTKP